ncbi:MAG: oxidoreductase [Clostridiales bacterium]|nr:MAG: oxidoreductase [Clostridiales bacterium]
MKKKYAIIGCGRISKNHIVAAKENNLDIVAMCDVNSESIKKIKEEFGIKDAKEYSDYKEMLEKEDIDLASICTESGLHGEIALYAIEKGVNLIVEKPIALSLEEADRIIEKSREKNVKVCACHQNRFNKSIQKIREAVDKDMFGKLSHGSAHIRWNREKNYYSQASWRGTWKQDGGALMNQCIHNIDLLRWMMGTEIDEVFAYTDRKFHNYIEAEDVGIAIVKFSNGSFGIIEGTTNVYPKNLEETLFIFGEKGTAKAGGKSVNLIEDWKFAGEDEEKVKEEFSENPPNIYGFGHTPLFKDVIEAINEDRDPYVDAVDGRNALELVLAIYKSAAEGRPVKLPLKDVKTTDFIGRFK